MAEKRSDAMLGKERLYDPGTGEVYEFQNGFYDQYRLNPQEYWRPSIIQSVFLNWHFPAIVLDI